MGATAGAGGFIGNSMGVIGQQNSPLKVAPAGGPSSLQPPHQQYNAISAHGTFYNQHRKTYSNKLPSIPGAQGVGVNNKTVDSSLSNTYYSRE
jgi:hypothetical protein